MNWKERVIRFNEKKDLESMLTIGRRIENDLPRINYRTECQFDKDVKERNDYIYREVLRLYQK